MLAFTDYAVLIVDWRLPGTADWILSATSRSRALDSSVLMLTARDAPDDRISGLDAGADDYLIKPFHFGELLARVRALQRRPGNTMAALFARQSDSRPRTRSVDPTAWQCTSTTIEFRILELLMVKSPAVVDRRQIAQHAWKDETDPSARTPSTSAWLDCAPSSPAAVSRWSRCAAPATGWSNDERFRRAQRLSQSAVRGPHSPQLRSSPSSIWLRPWPWPSSRQALIANMDGPPNDRMAAIEADPRRSQRRLAEEQRISTTMATLADSTRRCWSG